MQSKRLYSELQWRLLYKSIQNALFVLDSESHTPGIRVCEMVTGRRRMVFERMNEWVMMNEWRPFPLLLLFLLNASSTGWLSLASALDDIQAPSA